MDKPETKTLTPEPARGIQFDPTIEIMPMTIAAAEMLICPYSLDNKYAGSKCLIIKCMAWQKTSGTEGFCRRLELAR